MSQAKNITEADIIQLVLRKRVYQNVYLHLSKTNRATGALNTVPSKESRTVLQ